MEIKKLTNAKEGQKNKFKTRDINTKNKIIKSKPNIPVTVLNANGLNYPIKRQTSG